MTSTTTTATTTEIATVRAVMKGLAPLILHNGHLADPTSAASKSLKEITSKRTKQDADHEEIAKREFIASIYLNDDLVPCIPEDNLMALVIKSAKRFKRGPDAQCGVICLCHVPVEYAGPTDLVEMWADGRFRFTKGVKVGQARIMRTRCQIQEWTIEPTFQIDTTVVNPADFRSWLEAGGSYIGLCDWRPRFGRYSVTEFEVT